MIHQRHESVDGSGYPRWLKVEQILLEARILAVADVIESMVSHRPYRAARGIEEALAEIEAGRGRTYDTEVADASLKLFREDGFELPVQ
ncbi:HD-GYP domain-containing protein [Zhongshania arctica]|uniref:HD-GYP domain-containing protein n=1 Tax=Zhongshania arctica TaxID=3238302 RepID=A0ABV3TQM1_9GAMM